MTTPTAADPLRGNPATDPTPTVVALRLRLEARRDRRRPRPTVRRPRRLPPATVLDRWLDLSA